jgi:ABC-type phosphate transport system substrate-binding protein
MKPFLLLAALVAALAAPAVTSEVQVIANPGITVAALTSDDLKDIFLGAKTAVGGAAVEPVFEQTGAAHEAFLKTYLGKSDVALRNHFKTLVFTGKGAQPKAFASDAEVLKYVASTKGAIGYVKASADTAGAKKILVK